MHLVSVNNWSELLFVPLEVHLASLMMQLLFSQIEDTDSSG